MNESSMSNECILHDIGAHDDGVHDDFEDMETLVQETNECVGIFKSISV